MSLDSTVSTTRRSASLTLKFFVSGVLQDRRKWTKWTVNKPFDIRLNFSLSPSNDKPSESRRQSLVGRIVRKNVDPGTAGFLSLKSLLGTPKRLCIEI